MALNDYEELQVWQTDPFDDDTDDDELIDLVDRRPTVESTPPNIKITSEVEYRENVSVAPPRNRDNYNDFIFVQVSDETPITDFEVNGYYEPYYGDSFWKTSDYFQKGGTFQGRKNGYHVKSFAVPIYQHGVLGEDPEHYYVNATDANGNRVAIEIRPQQPNLLPDVEFSGAVPFLGGIAATAGAEVVSGGTALGSGISVTTAATVGGPLLVVGSAAAYSYDQRPAQTYDSDYVAGQQSLTVPTAESVETYPASDTPFDEPVKLPSGSVYEPDVPVGDGHERGFGWEYIKRTPGISDYDDVAQILRTPNAVDHYGDYDIVIGENPNGPGQIELWLLDGLVVSTTSTVNDYRGESADVDRIINKIINEKNDWDHNQLGNSEEQVKRNIHRILQNPDEVYEEIRDHDNAKVTVYVREMMLNGNKVVVFALVVNGEVITSFVPAGEAPAGSNYEGVYDRDYAINYIINEVLSEGMKKIEEFDEVIEEIDVGETK